MGSRRRRRVLVSLGVLVLLLLGAGAVLVLPRLGAVRCLLAFGEAAPDHHARLPGFRLLEDPERFGARRAWAAAPDGSGPHPTLVFVHGVTSLGIEDGRVLRAVEAFRRAGFLVVAPEVQAMVRLESWDDDLARLARLLHAVADGQVEGADGSRLGIVAISVGGPWALQAAARFRGAGGRGLRGLLLVGAPEDFRRVAHGWFSTPLPDAGEEARDPVRFEAKRAAEFGRNALWKTGLAAMGVGDDEAALRTWLEASWSPSAPPDGLATAQGIEVARLVVRGPGIPEADVDRLLDAGWRVLRYLSPAAWSDDLAPLRGVACRLLHGTHDPLVPVSEMARLEARLSGVLDVHALESGIVGHTAVGEASLSERWEHVVFLDAFLDGVAD
jgi:pimeloyl-ACP methyl ester carboxylesterase